MPPALKKPAAKQLNKNTKALPSHLIQLDPKADLSVGEQLQVQLHANALTVMDLFKEWDGDKSASVTRDEFHAGIRAMGFSAPTAAIDSVFDAFDADRSGDVDFSELKHALTRSPADVERELRQKNAEMKAKLKDAKAKTDIKGQDIHHDAPVRGFVEKGGTVVVTKVVDDPSAEVVRACLSTEVAALEAKLAAALARAAAAEATAAKTTEGALFHPTPPRMPLKRVATWHDKHVDDVQSEEDLLQATAVHWIAKLDEERAAESAAKAMAVVAHEAEARQHAAEEALAAMETRMATKEAELAARLTKQEAEIAAALRAAKKGNEDSAFSTGASSSEYKPTLAAKVATNRVVQAKATDREAEIARLRAENVEKQKLIEELKAQLARQHAEYKSKSGGLPASAEVLQRMSAMEAQMAEAKAAAQQAQAKLTAASHQLTEAAAARAERADADRRLAEMAKLLADMKRRADEARARMEVAEAELKRKASALAAAEAQKAAAARELGQAALAAAMSSSPKKGKKPSSVRFRQYDDDDDDASSYRYQSPVGKGATPKTPGSGRSTASPSRRWVDLDEADDAYLRARGSPARARARKPRGNKTRRAELELAKEEDSLVNRLLHSGALMPVNRWDLVSSEEAPPSPEAAKRLGWTR